MRIPIGTLCIIIKARPHLMGLHCEVIDYNNVELATFEYVVDIPANPAPEGKRWGAWGNQIMPIDPGALDMEGNEFQPTATDLSDWALNAKDSLGELEEIMKRVLSD